MPVVRFDKFAFDTGTRELSQVGPNAETTIQSLPPQPASLLLLLARRYPEVVTAEEIRQHLWPDVLVEYEQSLHFCVRQVRAALGDSASDPQYIQTIPRTGYRFLCESQFDPDTTHPSTTVPLAAAPDFRKPRRQARLLSVVAIAVCALVAAALGLRGSPDTVPAIAVMPFQTSVDQPTGIAERLVLRLTNHDTLEADVIGPTTTSTFAERRDGLLELKSRHHVDFIINCRVLTTEAPYRILAEVIRSSDGAHVWVREYPNLSDDADRISAELLQAVEDILLRNRP